METKILLEKISKNENIVFKKETSFIENFYKYFYPNFSHDRFKAIINSEIKTSNFLERKFRNSFSSYLFLLTHYKEEFNKNLLNKIYYLLFDELLNDDLANRILQSYYSIHSKDSFTFSVDFHVDCFKILNHLNLEEKTLISLFLLNYCLLNYGFCSLKISYKAYDSYFSYLNNYIEDDKKNSLYEFLFEKALNQPVQNKTYYLNLKPLDYFEINQ